MIAISLYCHHRLGSVQVVGPVVPLRAFWVLNILLINLTDATNASRALLYYVHTSPLTFSPYYWYLARRIARVKSSFRVQRLSSGPAC